ncbi:class I SAM-dependent methyltransferase [Neptuniibacter sp. CAU 1671]|uniref:class I SAM-dependent methyltransferase n=1 Tax=Neptuniibacter sp. CAU 1671 TaxID=3032593 RepID=UPI0023DAF455|nr:class I SAM-dependent methyltransferase [Neptuniibacter sp. CAU 1671]MDF2183120.1 class I SAM-dependent methyltransferase [Neptuniibacter sp. CAU 1671]
MTPKQIGHAYDTITHLWQRDDFNRNNGIEAHQRALAFVTNRGKALDVGCGCTGRFIDLLLGEGFTPEGVDISGEMIRLARQRHPQVVFHQQDICAWDMTETYDFITAWDSLWHIPLDQQEAVLTKLVASLNPGGVLIFSFGGTETADEHCDATMGPEVYYSTLGTHGFLECLIRQGCLCRHLEFDQYPELHAYLIVQKSQG